jgi:hypothetical protein
MLPSWYQVATSQSAVANRPALQFDYYRLTEKNIDLASRGAVLGRARVPPHHLNDLSANAAATIVRHRDASRVNFSVSSKPA